MSHTPQAAVGSGFVMARLRTLPVFAAALVAAIAGGIVEEYASGILGLMAMARMSLPQAMAAIMR